MNNENLNEKTNRGAIRPLIVRRQQGEIKMKAHEKLIRIIGRLIGRFAVGVGSALAVVCVVAIVSSAPALGPTPVVQPAEVIRLDPVIVTIAAERFDAIRAEEDGASRLVHVYGSGPKKV